MEPENQGRGSAAVHHDRSAARAAGETTSALHATTASFAEHRELLFSVAYHAREHVQARRRRYQPDPSARRAATERFMAAAVTQYRPADLIIRDAEVNGGPAALLFAGGELFGVLVVDPGEQGDRVCAIYSVVNPDKLTWPAGALRSVPEHNHTQADRSKS
jgi:hypothetical protein